MALLLCISLFYSPITAYAAVSTPVAPPTVEAEVIGTLLRIRTTSGFFAVEAVYVNDRRFNHRVDSALVIDISQYIATGGTIAVFAVDFAGNFSDTVLLSPPPPAQPSPPNNLTPDGQGEVLDHLTDGDGIEFITINTAAGNVFHLIIDHTRNSNNVYFLNAVTEWDLLALAAQAEMTAPPHINITPAPQPAEPIIIPHETPPPVAEIQATPPPTPTADDEDGGGRAGMFIFMAIAGAVAFGVMYYMKIVKPKQEREMYSTDEEYAEGDDFEDVDSDDAEGIEVSENSTDSEGTFNVDSDKYE